MNCMSRVQPFRNKRKTIHVTTLPKPLIASNHPEFSDIFQSDWDLLGWNMII